MFMAIWQYGHIERAQDEAREMMIERNLATKRIT
jgi:hypothetical protein